VPFGSSPQAWDMPTVKDAAGMLGRRLIDTRRMAAWDADLRGSEAQRTDQRHRD
jgi:hypothetical protein